MVAEGKIPRGKERPSEQESEWLRAATDNTNSAGRENAPVSDSVIEATKRFADAINFGKQYLSAQADRVRIVVRNIAIFAILGIVAALVAATILVSATVLLCVGVANAIGSVLGGRFWAGDMIVGVVVLGGIALAVPIVLKKIFHASQVRTRLAYERGVEN